MTDERTIVLHSYADPLEARMVQDKLKENGIPSFLNDENVLGLDPVGGTELRVLEKDLEEAKRVTSGK